MLSRKWYKGIWYKGIWGKTINIAFALIPLYLFFNSILFAQSKTNLEVFYELVDSSVIEFSSKFSETQSNIKLELNLGEAFSIFNNRIIAKAYSKGINTTAEVNGRMPSAHFVIDDAKVEYGESFRDGLFGDFYLPRNLSVKGNYLIIGNTTLMNNFSYSLSDTIGLDEVVEVENESYPFTKGNLPAEPFFSGLLEPIVALSTTALAIVLFFTIRSK